MAREKIARKGRRPGQMKVFVCALINGKGHGKRKKSPVESTRLTETITQPLKITSLGFLICAAAHDGPNHYEALGLNRT